MDEQKFNEFLHRFVGDLGATASAGGIVLGDRLGLYRALADGGPQTPDVLASSTDTAARYVEEWLRGQAASGYVDFDEASGTYSLNAEQAFALTDPDGAIFMPGAFQLALGTLASIDQVEKAFRTGGGVGWHEHNDDVFVGCERFFRPGYTAHLTTEWLPALDGVVEKLEQGGSILDVGCGLGASTMLMAERFPNSTVTGCDYHTRSIDLARKQAAERGIAERTRFDYAGASTFGGGPFDLITTFDSLHDMGDPVAAAHHILSNLSEGGTWMIVEPAAADDVAGNMNPVGRVFYGFSTFLCVPNAVSQGGARTLGAQAGENAIRQVTEEAGFTRFRRVAQTPFNLVYEVRR